MKPMRIIALWFLISMPCASSNVAEAGPIRNLFRVLRSAVPHQRQYSHRSGRKHNETPPTDSSTIESSSSPVGGPPAGSNVRAAQANKAPAEGKTDLPYGSPVPGKQGLVTSPFSANKGYVDVRGFPPGTPVKDPYTGDIFRTP